MRRSSFASRRGSMYLIVLFTTLVVVAMCFTGLDVQRAAGRGALTLRQVDIARNAALAGIELALQRAESVGTWRSSPTWTGTYTLNGARVTVTMIDPGDGSLSDDASEPVQVDSEAEIGAARHHLRVTLDAFYPPLASLRNAVHSGGAIAWNKSLFLATRAVGTNGAAAASMSSINAPVEAATTVAGATYRQSVTAAAPIRAMPGAGVSNYYVSNGTAINSGVLNLLGAILGGGRSQGDFLLSSGDNPFGFENAMGIYVIDMSGIDLELSNFRLCGTLVIKNAGTVTLKGSAHLAPATPGFPAIIVHGNLTVALDSAPLSESARGVNFNPVHTPYCGAGDSDKTDAYPSEINGLVYCTGTLTVSGQMCVRGAVLAGAAAIGGSTTVVYDPVYETQAPPGFRDSPRMIVRKGSWSRLVE